MACGTKSLADSSTGGSDPYGLNVESMTGKDSCQMELQESEVLALPAAGPCCSNPSRSQSQRVTYVYADAFNAAFKEYSASLLNKVNRPSVLEKLHELVQAAAELTGKVRHKEQERGL